MYLPVKVKNLLIFAFFAINFNSNLDKSYALPTAGPRYFTAPEISPNFEDVTIDVSTNFILRCESKEPIKWYFIPKSSSYLQTEEKKYNTQNPDRPYGTELILSNVKAEYVQYYYCMYDDIEENNLEQKDLDIYVQEGKSSRIYVFVDDPNTLLVPVADEMNFHFADEQSYKYVPCKPTTKDINVVLTGPKSEAYKSNDRNIIFDPYNGFKIFFHGIVDNGDYVCTPENHPDIEITFYFHVEAKRESKPADPLIEHVRIVEEPENRHVIEGENFSLTCEIQRSLGTLLNTEWYHRNQDSIKKDGRWHETNKTVGSNIVKTTLNIYNAKKNIDTGDYRCTASDGKNTKHDLTSIKVLNDNEAYIDLNEPTNTYRIEQKRGLKIRMVVHYKGHPKPEIEWLKPDKTKITLSDKSKFEVDTDDKKSVLNIKNPQLPDSGNYTVRAFNDKLDKYVEFQVFIRSQPIAYVEPIHYSMINEMIKIECLVDAYPEPQITWSFIPCKIEPKWPNCDVRRTIELNNMSETSHVKNLVSYRSLLKFIPEGPGKVICSAKNKIGETMKETEIRVGDIPDSVFILNPGDETKIAVGDETIVTCAALAYNYTDSINWFIDNRVVRNDKDVEIRKDRTPYSYKSILKFKKIDHQNSGTYECRAISIADNEESRYSVIKVHDPIEPMLSNNSIEDGSVIFKKMGESVELICGVIECIPVPTINWFKDNEPIIEDENISIEDGNTTLRIRVIRPKDNEGHYKCVISNRLRTVERSAEVKVSDIPVGIHEGWIAAISLIILVLIILIIFLIIRVYKDRQIRRRLKEIGIENFVEGCVGEINDAMTLDEQAELLPYDKNRYEFPKEKIHLGKQLGQGAFGVVHKAVCDGILPDEKETIVAVKMVKKSADNEIIKALASELKIMVHLGQHLNVVNLLGAVTKNIFKREMMVIVEYCRYGNIQNFLLKNRKRFINQINPETDLIDPTITSNDQRFSSDYEYNSQGLRYVHLVFPNHQTRNHNNNNNNNNKNNNSNNSTQNSRRISENDPRSGTRPGRPSSQGYIRQSELYYASEVDSAMTQQTVVDGEEVLSNNSVQPVWRTNYKSDSATDTLEITTSYLVSWAFQVARGMDYLAKRKVLHGDLAARNILLCEDNIVKICDFGLARSIIKNENYQKSEEARLPVKWLALESLGERIFSTRSDVWSFGIVLWELFSLSKVPYPGIDASGGLLYERLKDGYRMEKPPYANQELYEVMLECWRASPESRPLFDELEGRFGKMLEEEVTNHYIDLNEHYLRINEEYQKTNATDWIALMGSPTELAPPVPRYVNDSVIPEIKIENTDDYLKMSPKTGTAIFSPRPATDDYVKATNQFDFSRPLSPTTSNNIDSPILKNRNKDNIIPEEIPMLARQSYSDSEPEQSPSPRDIIKKFNSFNNTNNTNNSNNVHNNNLINSNKISPITVGVQQPPLTTTPTTNLPSHQKYISNDNYVNVKSKAPLAPLAATEAFTNPSYLILQNANEKKK